MVIINSFKYPESSIRCQQGNVRAVLDNKELGIGTLYVSEHTLCWHQRDNVGLTIDYPNISLHAISNDQTIYPEECVYIMIDGHISMPGDLPTSDEQNDDDSDAESTADISDLILIPECKELITQIYEVIKSCQVRYISSLGKKAV
ncbi:hypothetical protein JTB14_037309 [Gonioctena quinquepunctata]|nr:hypothetical protein JTB14_037309 [Gonioctena quinquepunctata]